MKTKNIGARLPIPLYNMVKEEADKRGINLSQLVIERIQNSNKMDKETLRPLVVELVQEAIQAERIEDYDPSKEYFEVGEDALDITELAPPLLADELNCLIVDAYARATEIKPNEPDTPFLVLLYEQLSKLLFNSSYDKVRYECRTDYREALEENYALALSNILADVRNELGPNADRKSFFNLLSDLLDDQAEEIFVDARKISFHFDRNQWQLLDQLIEKVNSQKPEEEQFSSLDSLMLFILGDKLREEAKEKFFGGFQYPELESMGKVFQASALEN